MNTFFVSDEILPESVLMTGLGGISPVQRGQHGPTNELYTNKLWQL